MGSYWGQVLNYQFFLIFSLKTDNSRPDPIDFHKLVLYDFFMARPLRIEYPGAVYHIMARGNEKKNIFLTPTDRLYFFKVLTETIKRYQWRCHCYCLMKNHYHLLIETLAPTLSIGMRHLNGVYSQYFNRVHKRVGHLFQGRFKGILVQKDDHLLELSRYIVLNPVKAKLCKRPEEFKWSSYQATVGIEEPAKFLYLDWILEQFGDSRKSAMPRYAEFCHYGIHDNPLKRTQGQIYFGDASFVKQFENEATYESEIPETQRFASRPPLSEILKDTENGIQYAYNQHRYTMKEIAKFLNCHYTTISKKNQQKIKPNVGWGQVLNYQFLGEKLEKTDNSRPDPKK